MAQEPNKPRFKIISADTPGEACWSCGVPATRSHAICGACGKMLIAAEGKSFLAARSAGEVLCRPRGARA